MYQYLAIDLGAESGRVILGQLAEGKVAVEELHRFPNGAERVGDTLRWDVQRLWGEVVNGLQKAAKSEVRPESLSVDSWALDYVLLNDANEVLSQPYSYRDARTEDIYRAAKARHGEADIYAKTGIQFMPINTFYQLLAEQKQKDGALGEAAKFLMIGDWFHYQLSGVVAQEESNASTTQLYDPVARQWSGELIRASGLRPDLFPPLIPPCTKLGSLLPVLQKATGLGAIDVIAGCVHDTGAAIAAVPATGDQWAYLSSGTWSLIGAELEKPLLSEAARTANFTNEIGLGGSSRFLRNASGLWLLQECRRAWERVGQKHTYSEITDLAREAQPFAFLLKPEASCFLRPDHMPEAIAAYCANTNQPKPRTVGEFARGIFESLALLYAEMLEMLEGVVGKQIHTLHIVGGGSSNDLLNQMTADATGRKVIAGPVEATAIGNILLQALTLGHIRSHAELRQIVRDSFPLREFEPRQPEVWAAQRAKYANLPE